MFYETFGFHIFYLAPTLISLHKSFNKNFSLRCCLFEATAVDAIPRLCCSGIHNRISLSLCLSLWVRSWPENVGKAVGKAESQEAQLYIPIAYVSTIWGSECTPLWSTTSTASDSPISPIESQLMRQKLGSIISFCLQLEQECSPSSAPRVESIIQFSQLFPFVFDAS